MDYWFGEALTMAPPQGLWVPTGPHKGQYVFGGLSTGDVPRSLAEGAEAEPVPGMPAYMVAEPQGCVLPPPQN